MSVTYQAEERTATSEAVRPIQSLQIGVSWFKHVAGGLNRVYSDLYESLPQAGVGFRGVLMGPKELEEESSGALQVFAPEGASMLTRLRGVRRVISRVIAERRFDVIASHFALYTAPVLDKIAGQLFVMHFHGPWAAESAQEGAGRLARAAKRGLEKSVYSRAQRVITLSKAFAEVAVREYGVRPEIVRVVPGSVDLDRFGVDMSPAEARELLEWPQGRPILFSVRRLARRMGLDRLISAMKTVVAKEPDVLLCIAGKGHARQELRDLTDKLDLGRNVRFLGYVPDERLPLAFRAADINLVPTLALEGFGLTAAEALAAGTPSMVSPVGGLPEVVSGLCPDLVFRSAAPNDLAEGILDALSGAIRLPDAERCREFARRNFNPMLAARRIAAVYREVL